MSTRMELRNEHLCVEIVPAEGGRISSLRCLNSGLEFLLQSTRQETRPYLQKPGREASFAQGAVAGIEECLPTVACCQVDGQTIPDHGDFWQLPWEVLSSSPEHVHEVADGFSQPLRYEKTVRLRNAALWLESRITNTGVTEACFLYATHPLLAVEPGDRIVLPPECRSLTLHESRRERLGRMGQRVGWPDAQSAHGEVKLDVLDGPAARTAEMLYTDRLQEGWCGLYRDRRKQGIALRFETDRLPYLGLWICCGGWPEGGEAPQQYAFAPEPATAPCGSLEQAMRRGAAVTLKRGESFSFSVTFRISEPGIEFDSFRRFAAGVA